jgi:hypothetical protein
MKKIIQRKDLDLKLIFDGLVGDNFSQELEQEIKKLDTIIQNETAETTAFTFLKRELK